MSQIDPHYYPGLKDNLEKIAFDNITSVTLNTDALKGNFEAIVAILKGLVKKVDSDKENSTQANKEIKELKEKLQQLEDKQVENNNNLNEKILDTNSQIQDIKDSTDKNTQDLEKLQDALRELRDSQNDLSKAHENGQNDLKSIKERLDDHDRQIQDLFQQIGATDRSKKSDDKKPVTPLSDANSKRELENLKNDLSDIRKNFEKQMADLKSLLEDFVKKDEFNEHKDQTENKLQSHQESIDDLYNQIRDLNSRISDKLNCENFDEHMEEFNNLKNIVISLTNKGGDAKSATIVQQVVQSGSNLSTKDTNLLKELGQKFPELEALLKKLNKDFGEHVITFKTFADEANRKIHNNDEQTKNLKAETSKKISDLEAALRSLRDQLLNFNAPLPASNSGSSNTSSKDTNQGSADFSVDLRRIQMALTTINDRFSGVEKDIAELQKLKEKVYSIQEVTYDNKHKIGNIEEELSDLRNLRARVELLEQLFRDRERDAKSSGGKARGDNINISSGGVTADQVRQMIDEEITKLRDEILALIEALRAELAKKADAEDLYKSEAALLEKLDQIAGALMKRAQADKSDTKKALMFLEKKIKEITLVIFGNGKEGEEGAILAKKPWNPWSCASCDGKLKEYPGALIDHKHWNKLPQRETSPGKMTQGKFGKGWTRWSDNKKSSTEKTREGFSGGFAKGGETLPEINNRDGLKSQQESSRMNE